MGFCELRMCPNTHTQRNVSYAGVISVCDTAGAVSTYDVGSDITAVTAVSLAFDGTKYRLCVDLACPRPRTVRPLALMT